MLPIPDSVLSQKLQLTTDVSELMLNEMTRNDTETKQLLTLARLEY